MLGSISLVQKLLLRQWGYDMQKKKLQQIIGWNLFHWNVDILSLKIDCLFENNLFNCLLKVC